MSGVMRMTEWFNRYGNMLFTATGTHLLYVVICVSIAFVVALSLGLLLSRKPRVANVIVAVASELAPSIRYCFPALSEKAL